MDTKQLVAYFGRASTCYTCSSTDYKIDSASGSVFTVPTYGYSWRMAMEAEIDRGQVRSRLRVGVCV